MAKVIDRVERGHSSSDTDPEIDDVELEAQLEKLMRQEAAPERPAKNTGDPVKAFYRRAPVMLLAALVVAAAVLFGVRYLVYAGAHETTDDAFIEGHVIQISPKVAGHILKVYVNDNQHVSKGDLLAEIDPRDYQAKLAQAKAEELAAQSKEQAASIGVGVTTTTTGAGVDQASSSVQTAKSNVDNAKAAVEAARGKLAQSQAQVNTAMANSQSARAEVEAVQAEATRAAAEAERYRALFGTGAVARQQFEDKRAQALSSGASLQAAQKKVAAADAQISEARAAEQSAQGALQQAQAQVAVAQSQVGEASGRLAAANAAPQQVAASRAQVGTANADVEQANATVQQADLNLSYTKIYAPEDGTVTRKAVEEGAYVQVGQALLAIVPDDLWVIANFKETQLNRMRPGQSAEIKVDAYPGRTFKGHVDSIQTGTGARFSVMPPENATGNYVKVVQRVPVKIVFDERTDPDHPIGPGMSVEPEVTVK